MATKADLALYANLFSKGLSTYGDYQQYQGLASVAGANAGLYNLEGEGIIADSEYAAKKIERQGKTFIGSQIAKYAKAGVTFEGSPMKVVLEAEKNIREDVLMTKYNAVRKANQLGFQAMNKQIEASAIRTRATTSRTSGLLDMFATFATAKWGS